MRYPPAVALINAVVKARTRDGAMNDAGEIVRALRPAVEPFRVLGPAPAPLSRLKGEHRAQFFIKGTHRGGDAAGAAGRARRAPGDQAPDDRRRRSDECVVSVGSRFAIGGSYARSDGSGSESGPA